MIQAPESQEIFQGAVITWRAKVDPAWIDVNGHVNVAWYDHIFDQGEHGLFLNLGLEDEFIQRTGLTLYRLEKLLNYSAELLPDSLPEMRSCLIWSDGRLLHSFHELWDARYQRRAAQMDALSIHVDLATRRSAKISHPGMLAGIEHLLALSSSAPRPKGVEPRQRGRRLSHAMKEG